MKTSEFINFVKEIPSPEEVEVYRLFMNRNCEYFVEPVREVVVKRGGYTLLKAADLPQKLGAISSISRRPANMTLAECMDMLLELSQKNELLAYDDSGAMLWESVAQSTPTPEAVVAHLFYNKAGSLFIASEAYLPDALQNKIV